MGRAAPPPGRRRSRPADGSLVRALSRRARGGGRDALEADGFRVAIDRPFAGALVPLRWYGTDARVTAVMLEVRRGTYMDEATGDMLAALAEVAGRLRAAVGDALDDAG